MNMSLKRIRCVTIGRWRCRAPSTGIIQGFSANVDGNLRIDQCVEKNEKGTRWQNSLDERDQVVEPGYADELAIDLESVNVNECNARTSRVNKPESHA